jgi:hypothetical protein
VVIRGDLPATPDKVVALFETGGAGQERAFDGTVVEQPTLQVLVRGAADDYDVARLQIEKLYQTMSEWGAFTASGTRYLNLEPLQPPFPLGGRDGNKRRTFSVNFLIHKELSATS